MFSKRGGSRLDREAAVRSLGVGVLTIGWLRGKQVVAGAAGFSLRDPGVARPEGRGSWWETRGRLLPGRVLLASAGIVVALAGRPAYGQTVCGDTRCDLFAGEDCFNCPQDCPILNCGACCFKGVNCLVMQDGATECFFDFGGVYQGDGRSCDPNPCGGCVPATEICNGVDDDCDGLIDEEFPNCDDGIACTDDTCVSATCVHTPNNSRCDDGLFCNGPEICNLQLASCMPGLPPTCEDNNFCTVDSCDNQAGCTHVPLLCEACCLPLGRCVNNMLPSDCVAQGGVPKGLGSVCLGDSNGDGIDDLCFAPPCAECGPGLHWIHNPPCPPGGTGQDNVPSSAVVGLDLNLDPNCIADANIGGGGPVTIKRNGPFDDATNFAGTRPVDGHLDVIDTEIIAMSLTSGGTTLRVGAGQGVGPLGGLLTATKGAISEQPGNPLLADSFFDIFVEIDVGGGSGPWLYNQTPIFVGQVIDCVPPKAIYYHFGGCTPLYTSPTPGQGIHVANLTASNHVTYPACCSSTGVCTPNVSVQKCQQLGGTTVPACLGDINPANGIDDACDPKCEVAPGSPTGCTNVCPPGTPVGQQCLPSSYGCDPVNPGSCGVLACNCDCHLIFGAAGPFCQGSCPNVAEACPPVPLGDGSIGNPYRCDCAPPPECAPNSTGTDCNPVTCLNTTEKCLARCGKLNPFTGTVSVSGCDCRTLTECHLMIPTVPGVVAGVGGNPCVVVDNGGGTVTLPPDGCEYLSPDEVHVIINGLPAGTTIELAPIHKNFICSHPGKQNPVCSYSTLVDCDEEGGSLGGEMECSESDLELDLSVLNPTCPGPLCGYARQITVPMAFETHTAPRTPGDPVQSFDTDMFRLFGQLPIGDPDFDLLRVVGGTDFGLPSPGHTTLTKLPGGGWAVDSFFDIEYRIDFIGAPGGPLAGRSGSTTATIRMQTGAPFRCEGLCPTGFVCEDKRIVNADGTIDLCCDCKPQPPSPCPLPTVNPWCTARQATDCVVDHSTDVICLVRDARFPTPTGNPIIEKCDCFDGVPGCGPVNIKPNAGAAGFTVSCPPGCPPGENCELHYNGVPSGFNSRDSSQIPPFALVTCDCAKRPPPDPHRSLQGTSVKFGTNDVPTIPADFFYPGSQPFTATIVNMLPGPMDTLIQRSGPIVCPVALPADCNPVEIEIVALDLVSASPITVTGTGLDMMWDVAVGLSVQPQPEPPGPLNARKTHPNGGTFQAEIRVLPRITFTEVSNPGNIRTIDYGLELMPAIRVNFNDGVWVINLAPHLVGVIAAPSNGNFVPGVDEQTPGQPNTQMDFQSNGISKGGGVGHPVGPVFLCPLPQGAADPCAPFQARDCPRLGTTEVCVPTVYQIIQGTPPQVLECGCRGTNECHVVYNAAAGASCVNLCPDPTMDCTLVKTDTDGDGVDDQFSCDCVAPPVCEPNSTGTGCNSVICPDTGTGVTETCQKKCVILNPLTGTVFLSDCDCMGPNECHMELAAAAGGGAADAGTVAGPTPTGDCVVVDDGSGTVKLPPDGCPYLSPDEFHLIFNGLPAGVTIEIGAIHKDFICNRQPGSSFCSFPIPPGVDCDDEEPNDPTDGAKECHDSTLELNMRGTGLGNTAGPSTYMRTLSLPVRFETHTGPRTPGMPVQSFDTDMFRLEGELGIGDPDFDLLKIRAGTDFGMPSPGHTTLTRLPTGNWAVDSFFDIFYEIEFTGAPGGPFADMHGSTTGTIRMATKQFKCVGDCPPDTDCVEKRTPLADGTVKICCECEPLPTVCEPTVDHKACVPNTCPLGVNCKPKRIQCFPPPRGCEVVECECLDGDPCHPEMPTGAATEPVCQGSCPIPPQQNKCVKHKKQIAGGLEYYCDCKPVHKKPIAADTSVPGKNRNLSVAYDGSLATTAGPGVMLAMRLRLTDLQNPNPPNLPQFPPPNFSGYESATCAPRTCVGGPKNGAVCVLPAPVPTDCPSPGVCTAAVELGNCERWAGRPGMFLESQDVPGGLAYRASRLQCSPTFFDWSPGTNVNVTGAEIVPSSLYAAQFVDIACADTLDEECFSEALVLGTARSGDVTGDFNPPTTTTQPDVLDVAQLVAKVKNLPGALVKSNSQLQPNLPELNADVNALDIVAVVDAAKGFAYAFGGPCPCPSTVTCGSLICSTPGVCATAFGAESLCVKTCVGGTNDGEPCIKSSHCPPMGVGICGVAFCRDRCGRCTPP